MSDIVSNYKLPISAGLSGIAEVSVTHWLDRIKTKKQEYTLKGIKINLYDTLKNIYLSGGLGNFYIGILPRLIGIFPMRMVYWTTIIKMNKYVENYTSNIKYIMPGLVAGSVQTLIDNPIEVLKIKLMTKQTESVCVNNSFESNFNKLKKLYTGFTPTILRNSIFAVVVSSFVQQCGTKTDNKFLIGAIGGFIGSVLSQPFDVVKTELQRTNKNILNKSTHNMLTTFVKIIKKNPLDLWSGGLMRSILAFANMGVGFYTLSFIQKHFFPA